MSQTLLRDTMLCIAAGLLSFIAAGDLAGINFKLLFYVEGAALFGIAIMQERIDKRGNL